LIITVLFVSHVSYVSPVSFVRHVRQVGQGLTGLTGPTGAHSKKGGIFLSPEMRYIPAQGNALGKYQKEF
jgi:hypothetical protein